jgi:hypothetical protein
MSLWVAGSFRVALSFLVFGSILRSQAEPASLCPAIVGILVNQFVFHVPLSATARVELHRCEENVSGTLQIAAWSAKAVEPSLVIDTTDFTVVQTAARQNVYVIETTGGPRDRVYVVMYENGKPVLKLQRTTKGTAKITIARDSLDLIIPDIYAGDAPPRTEMYHYDLQ